jgi:hypothetical protein
LFAAEENRSWGYERIVGALANLGYELSDQTVGNVLRHHDRRPAPQRKDTTTWAKFIRIHLTVLAARVPKAVAQIMLPLDRRPQQAILLPAFRENDDGNR